MIKIEGYIIITQNINYRSGFFIYLVQQIQPKRILKHHIAVSIRHGF